MDHVASLSAAAPPSFYATILDLDQRESDPVVGFWEGPGKPWIAGGAKRGPAATGLPPTQSLRPAAHSNPFVEQAQPGQPPRLPEFIKNEMLDKRVLVPRIEGHTIHCHQIKQFKNLVVNQYGILEPTTDAVLVQASEVDVCLVPGAAFDHSGNRIGFGKGYYDRLLAKSNSYNIALAYDFQMVDHIEHEPHDIKMNAIANQSELIVC